MRIIVCGGRNYKDRKHVFATLDKLNKVEIITEVIDGGATGADWLASQWSMAHGVKNTRVYAEWDLLGKKAGPLRNQQMLDLKPDVVVAFPGGTGTAHMVRIAKEAAVRVYEIR